MSLSWEIFDIRLPILYAGLKHVAVAPVFRTANKIAGYSNLFSLKIPTTWPGLQPNVCSSAAMVILSEIIELNVTDAPLIASTYMNIKSISHLLHSLQMELRFLPCIIFRFEYFLTMQTEFRNSSTHFKM